MNANCRSILFVTILSLIVVNVLKVIKKCTNAKKNVYMMIIYIFFFSPILLDLDFSKNILF